MPNKFGDNMGKFFVIPLCFDENLQSVYVISAEFPVLLIHFTTSVPGVTCREAKAFLSERLLKSYVFLVILYYT